MFHFHKPRKIIILLLILVVSVNSYGQKITIKRLTDKPIISADMLMNDDGNNINGPSLIKVPSWVKSPLGKYYLYFANHHGKYIRLAYADNLKGPWKIYQPGTLKTSDITFIYQGQKCKINHVASPDVLIDNKKQQIILYYHLHGNNVSIKSIPQVTLRPEYKYEGVDQPLIKSVSGYAKKPVNELRDPAIFKDNDQLYLLYSVAGESGIGIAEILNLD